MASIANRLLLTLTFALAGINHSFASEIESFQVSIPTNRVLTGASMPVSIRAVNSSAATVIDFSGQLPLETFYRQAPTVVISEFETTNRVVEFTNPTLDPVNIGGWDFQITDNSDVLAHLRFPDATIPPGGVFLFSKDPIESAAEVFYPESPARQWTYVLYTLRDKEGNLVDQVSSGFIPNPPTGLIWKVALPMRPGPWARVGTENRFSANDWAAVNNASRGQLNPGLTLPWAGSDVLQKTTLVQFTNGVWSGSVLLDAPTFSGAFVIRDDLNHSGRSERFSVENLPPLILTFESAVYEASENVAGPVGKGIVSLPEPAAADLQVALVSSDTNEFEVPAMVTILAGQTSAQFTLTNRDDTLSDGASLVTISAFAPEHSSAQAALINRDNENGALFVVMPNVGAEDTGFQIEPGRVFVGKPAEKDCLVKLRADPILNVPETVIIPKGRSSALFRFSIGNDFKYSAQLRARVWAQTENWPEAEGGIRIEDNDDPSYTLEVPQRVWQGEPTEGLLRFRVPRHSDILVRFVAQNHAAVIPESIILPAGETELRFPISYGAGGGERLFVFPDYAQTETNFSVLPNTPLIDSITIGFYRSAVFSGETLPLEATLADFLGTPQYTNVLGELRLIDPSGTIPFATQAIRFTNGFWSGSVTLNGSGAGLQFQFSAAGFTNSSLKFDLLEGGIAPIDALDMAWHARSNQFLVCEGPLTNATGRLLALAPPNTNIVKSLNLPAPASGISISEDGSTAWLILNNARFQKVDLIQWSLAESFPVSTNAALIARDLLVLPGGADKFVAIVGPNSNQPSLSVVQLFENGIGNTNTAPCLGSGGSLSAVDLIRGRNALEFFSQGSGGLGRYTVDTEVHLAGEAPVGGDGPFGEYNTVYADGFLYNSNAGRVDPETLEIENPYNFFYTSSGKVYPFPGISRLFKISQGNVKAYDIVSGEQVATTSMSGLILVGTIVKSESWTRGFAYLMNYGVVFMTSPFVEPTRPDLEIVFVGPKLQTNVVQFLNEPFSWEFEAINHGPGPAPATTIRMAGVGGIELGSLQPNEHRRVFGPPLNAAGGLTQAETTIFSALVDPNPANNRTLAQTQVKLAIQFPGFDIPMTGTSLVSSSDRTQLYVGYLSLPGADGPGVAVFDPESGTVVKTISYRSAPKKLALSPDNHFLYGITATNEIVRWNLQTSTVDFTLAYTNETIFDMVVAPQLARSLVVATTQRVITYIDDSITGSVVNRAADFRCLGFSGTTLWLAETGRLFRYTISSGLTQSGSPIDISLPTQYYQFVADAQRLYFDSYAFDIGAQTVIPGFISHGLHPLPESNALLSLFEARAQIIDQPSLKLTGEDALPVAPRGDSARFGDRGIAYIGPQQQLILYKVSTIPLALPPADLEVTLAPLINPYRYLLAEWHFTVRNNSTEPAQNVKLILDRPPGLRDPVFEPANPMTVFYTSAFDLGTLAPGASRLVKLKGVSFGGQLPYSARVISNSPDPNNANNRVSGEASFGAPTGSLVLSSISGPRNLNRGEEAVYTFEIRNAGATSVDGIALALTLGEGVELPDEPPGLFSLAAGETKLIPVRLRMTRPGLITIVGRVDAIIDEMDRSDNQFGMLAYVADPSADLSQMVAPDQRLMVWSESRQEIIASFGDSEWSVMGLDPKTLRPNWSVPIDTLPQYLALTDDGRYVWAGLAGGRINRIDMETHAKDMGFNISQTQAQVWAIAAAPGKPDIILIAYDPGFTGQNRVQAFQNGVAKPAYFNGSGYIVFTRGGRGFISNSRMLREFSLGSNGLTEIGNFDSVAPYGAIVPSVLDDTIYYANGRSYNVVTRQVDETLDGSETLVVNPEQRQLYRTVFQSLSFGRAYFLENFDIDSNRSDWRNPIQPAPLVPIGTNGVLLLAPSIIQFNFDNTARSADLVITASGPETASGPNVPITLSLTVTNSSIWRANGTTITVDFPSGISLLMGNDWVPSERWQTNLGSFYGSTNFTLQVRSEFAGEQVFVGNVSSSIPDPDSADNAFQIKTTIVPQPIFLVDDLFQSEAFGYVRAWLSSPAASEIRVAFTASPLTAALSDISQPTGVFTFMPGSTFADADIISRDSDPEFDETIRLEFSSDARSLIRAQAVLTILNDDFPRLTMNPPASITEGNTGTKSVVINLTLAPSPFASEVEYETVSGTALSGRDFVQQSGRLRFAPNQTTNAITLQIIGNTEFEPIKTFSVILKNPVNLAYLNSSGSVSVSIRNDDPPPPFNMSLASLTQTSLSLQFEALAGVNYQLETRTNLLSGSWSLVFSPVIINGTNGQFTITRPPAMRPINFYRIRAN